MNMTPNINGTSPADLIRLRVDISDAIHILQERMRDGWPNMRDYQLAPNPSLAFRADCIVWEAMNKALAGFSAELAAEAEAL